MAERRERLDLELDQVRVLPIAEPDRRFEPARRSDNGGGRDHAPAIAGRIAEAAPGRVEEHPVAWLEPGRVGPAVLGEGGALLADDPAQRLAVGNRQKVVSRLHLAPRRVQQRGPDPVPGDSAWRFTSAAATGISR